MERKLGLSQGECVSPVEIAGRQLPPDRQSLRPFFYFQFWLSSPLKPTQKSFIFWFQQTQEKQFWYYRARSDTTHCKSTHQGNSISLNLLLTKFWWSDSQTGCFLPFTYLIRSCCSSSVFLDCLSLFEISFQISPVSPTLSRPQVVKCKAKYMSNHTAAMVMACKLLQ